MSISVDNIRCSGPARHAPFCVHRRMHAPWFLSHYSYAPACVVLPSASPRLRGFGLGSEWDCGRLGALIPVSQKTAVSECQCGALDARALQRFLREICPLLVHVFVYPYATGVPFVIIYTSRARGSGLRVAVGIVIRQPHARAPRPSPRAALYAPPHTYSSLCPSTQATQALLYSCTIQLYK